jgi:hypothetical protein
MAKETTRVQMEMPPKSMERLAALKDKTEASSYAEVVKNALRLYEALIKEQEEFPGPSKKRAGW